MVSRVSASGLDKPPPLTLVWATRNLNLNCGAGLCTWAGPAFSNTQGQPACFYDAVGPSLRNPGSAKYHWAKFPALVTEGSVNYCATVDARSPSAAYNGRQAYIVETQMSGNRVSSAVIGLIAGGNDFAIVTNMYAKYGLDPRNASEPSRLFLVIEINEAMTDLPTAVFTPERVAQSPQQ